MAGEASAPWPDVRPSVRLSPQLGEAPVTVGLGPNPSSAASELCRPGRVVSPLCFPVFICKVVLTTVPNT